jgi:hypothetical protein
MSKLWLETRDETGAIIKTAGPLDEWSPEYRKSFETMMQVADAHNRLRPPGSAGGGGRLRVHVRGEQ